MSKGGRDFKEDAPGGQLHLCPGLNAAELWKLISDIGFAPRARA